MHQFTNLPLLRHPGRPEPRHHRRGSQNPTHQFRQRSGKTRQPAVARTHAPGIARPALPPSRPECNETMVGLARDRSTDNSVDKCR